MNPYALLFGATLFALLLSGGRRRIASRSQGSVRARTDDDWQALWTWSQTLGTTPQILGLLLFEESGMDPGVANSMGCVGLNQFCPGTYESWVDLDADDYLDLSMKEQLDYIGPYWQSKPDGAFDSTRDLFWLSLTPVTWVRHASSGTVVNDANILGARYATQVASANSGIAQGRSTITAGDIDSYLDSVAQSPGWQYALQRIEANNPSTSNS
jgi:hypothetical protein